MLLAACTVPSPTAAPYAFSIALIGDSPYGASPTETQEFKATPAFIAAINKDKDVSLVLHAGDIHSGRQHCTQAYNASVFALWREFKSPLIYTPGDNEWMDCHKKKEGGGTYNKSTGAIDYLTDAATGAWVNYAGGDPPSNLQLVRSIFFTTPGQTLGRPITVHTQAKEFDTAFPADSSFIENMWYVQSGVLFAAINIPGSSNNGTDPWYGAPSMGPVQQQEVLNRTGATLRWLDTAFKAATKNAYIAMVLLVQADMWDLDGKSMQDAHLTGFKQYIDKIASLSKAFGKPVLLINGDSHFYRTDNPLSNGVLCRIEVPSITGTKSKATERCETSVSSGVLKGISDIADPYRIVQVKGNPTYSPSYDVANFRRIGVHGNATPGGTDQEYIKLTIDPAANAPSGETAFGPFRWVRIQP